MDTKTKDTKGIDPRLFDGYDGAATPPDDDFIKKLLADAPPELKARAEEFAKQQKVKQST